MPLPPRSKADSIAMLANAPWVVAAIVVALLLGAALQTLLLITFGTTPMAMALSQVAAMAVTGLLVGGAHLCDNRSDEHGGR